MLHMRVTTCTWTPFAGSKVLVRFSKAWLQFNQGYAEWYIGMLVVLGHGHGHEPGCLTNKKIMENTDFG